MKKYSFLVYHREYLPFLEGVQNLGVLHVIEKESGEIENDELRQMYHSLNEMNTTIKFLSKRQLENYEDNTKDDAALIVSELKNIWADEDEYRQKLTHAEKEAALLQPWGNFDMKLLEKLENEGIRVSFRMCPVRNYDPAWEENYYLSQIDEIAGQIYFVVIEKKDEPVEINAEEVRLPARSLKEILDGIEELKEILVKTEEVYDDYAVKYLHLLEAERKNLMSSLDFQKVILSTSKEAEEKLMFLEGWVPKDKEEELNKYLEDTGVYHLVEEPGEEEQVPIKLKNTWFARLFEPVGQLYSMPQYTELDLTPFFAPFFMMFFGFCLGDVGYGLVILVATFFIKPRVSKKVRPIITLGQFLGAATIFMGIVSGTFFGIKLMKTDFLFFPSLRFMMLNDQQLMYLAVIIGGIQILFGICIRAAKQIIFSGWRSSLATLGWVFILTCGAILFLLFKLDKMDKETAIHYGIIAAIIGGIPVLFMNSPGKNIFLNVGLGLWDTYGMISGLLGDTLSYIRLFALGLSSAVLGFVFNQIAVGLSGHIPVLSQIFMILILLFGHSLNLGLSALGSFVHPLRLTFVEFYKNAGFEGGGLKYKPFSK